MASPSSTKTLSVCFAGDMSGGTHQGMTWGNGWFSSKSSGRKGRGRSWCAWQRSRDRVTSIWSRRSRVWGLTRSGSCRDARGKTKDARIGGSSGGNCCRVKFRLRSWLRSGRCDRIRKCGYPRGLSWRSCCGCIVHLRLRVGCWDAVNTISNEHAKRGTCAPNRDDCAHTQRVFPEGYHRWPAMQRRSGRSVPY